METNTETCNWSRIRQRIRLWHSEPSVGHPYYTSHLQGSKITAEEGKERVVEPEAVYECKETLFLPDTMGRSPRRTHSSVTAGTRHPKAQTRHETGGNHEVSPLAEELLTADRRGRVSFFLRM